MYMFMHHIFIHSSVDGHLGYFCILTVVNSATVNIRMHVSFGISVFVFFPNIYPRLSLLDFTVLQSYSTQNNMVLAHTKRNRIKSPQMNSQTYGQLIQDNEVRLYNGEKTVSSINGAGKLNNYMWKNGIRTFPHTIYKNELKRN